MECRECCSSVRHKHKQGNVNAALPCLIRQSHISKRLTQPVSSARGRFRQESAKSYWRDQNLSKATRIIPNGWVQEMPGKASLNYALSRRQGLLSPTSCPSSLCALCCPIPCLSRREAKAMSKRKNCLALKQEAVL